MIDSVLQARLHNWRVQNFPHADADQQLLGVVEELGELAHANLKQKQGIREKTVEDEKDAIGDLMIYMQGYCAYRGWDIVQIFETTAKSVMERNWNENPRSGEATSG